ncbi:alpha/beta hydrolase [Vibrio sp. SS-MA-C1-2]|uniref:alpha/beta hydrolase n=1 Tax=Vibrio sp. SS-MA-C1-2 TaxID=2908646 RepID=UPI001F3D7272|nr:alpha/beta hydrolase [Vibrio sp. SS-MA-C1-2]UJF18375.1 alpha/beta hydrolase [Vibrio sp. SS-MA-C1-2]
MSSALFSLFTDTLRSIKNLCSKPHRIFLLCLLLFITACSNKEAPEYQSSSHLPSYQQANFSMYVEDQQAWLSENRAFITDDKALEITLNSPFELKPERPNGKAVLLVHGLSDSPYSFHDVANHLVQRGYLVRAILLPGHGSKAGDLTLATYQDWQQAVAHHIELLKKQYDQIWLGGYSTGTNLVTAYALEKSDKIAGLLLFSPAFEPESSQVKYAPLASYFVKWADKDPEDNLLRYNSLAMNGVAAYYQTVKSVQDELEQHQFNKPVVMIVSEADSVIDGNYAAEAFDKHFTNPNNKVIWFGEDKPTNITEQGTDQVTLLPMPIEGSHISNASHMAMLFDPQNPYYGTEGSILVCNNGQTEAMASICQDGGDVWYSAWGYQEEGKVHARLTFNPYYSEMLAIIDHVMSHDSAQSVNTTEK